MPVLTFVARVMDGLLLVSWRFFIGCRAALGTDRCLRLGDGGAHSKMTHWCYRCLTCWFGVQARSKCFEGSGNSARGIRQMEHRARIMSYAFECRVKFLVTFSAVVSPAVRATA